MNVNQVLAVMMEMAPQLQPMLDPCNPGYTIIMNDGSLIDTCDTEDYEWEMLDVMRKFRRTDIKTEEQLRKVIAEMQPYAIVKGK